MMNHRIPLTGLILVLALGTLTPQFAQEAPKDREKSDQQRSLHSLMGGFIRTINTAEVSYYSEHASFGSWQSLLADHHVQEYLNGWLTQFYPQMHFGTLPEVLPGVNLRLNWAPDGESYSVLVEDAADKDGFAFLSDERGVIRECKFLQ